MGTAHHGREVVGTMALAKIAARDNSWDCILIRQREACWCTAGFLLFPFYSVQDPNPCSNAAYIQRGLPSPVQPFQRYRCVSHMITSPVTGGKQPQHISPQPCKALCPPVVGCRVDGLLNYPWCSYISRQDTHEEM